MDYASIVIQAAKAVKVSSVLLLAICTHESNLNNITVPDDGGSSSIGICQIKEKTAFLLGYKGTAKGLLNPKTNAHFAALYLKYQYQRYGDWCKATSAYNSGTFNESDKNPGKPKNLQYVLEVKKKLNKHFQNLLSCDNL